MADEIENKIYEALGVERTTGPVAVPTKPEDTEAAPAEDAPAAEETEKAA